MEEKENLVGGIFKLKRKSLQPKTWWDAEGVLIHLPFDRLLLYCRNVPHSTGVHVCFLDLTEYKEMFTSFIKMHDIESWIKENLEKIS